LEEKSKWSATREIFVKTPVGSHPGMGHTGLYDMAGNVKEWCFNAVNDSDNQEDEG
jgi:formylglycine-generating enzyme required for sulfatase activity